MDIKLQKYYKIIEYMPKSTKPYFIELKNKKKITTAIVQATEIRAFLSFVAAENEYVHIKDIPLSILENCGTEFFEQYFQSVTANSCIIKYSYLNMFYMFLMKERLISYNPLWNYEIPDKTKSKEVSITNKEFKETLLGIASGMKLSEKEASFAAATQFRDIAIISLFYHTGISLSTLNALNVNDVQIGEDLSNSIAEARSVLENEGIKDLKGLYRSWLTSEKTYDSNTYKTFHKSGMLLTADNVILLEPQLCATLLLYFMDNELHPDGALFLSLRKRRLAARTIEYMIEKHFSRYIDKHVNTHILATSRSNRDNR